jgi:hypothetical protein
MLLGHDLQPGDYIFPHLSSNGTVQNKPISHDTVQKNVREFAAATGLERNFTTHSFRRGGAQYRFMKAPIGECWSLAKIRWWGGWAEGEHVSTTYQSSVLFLNPVPLQAKHFDPLPIRRVIKL